MVGTVEESAARTHDIDGLHAWLRLAVSMAVATIGGVGMWAVVVVLPAVQAEFGIDRSAASLPYTLTMVGFALGNIVVGRSVDRTGFMLPALLSAVAMGAGFLLSSVTGSVVQLALVHGVLIGAGSSITFGPLIADISHWFDRHRGKAVAAAACGNYLAGALWPLAMQGFVDSAGWRATYAGIGVIAIVTMVPLILLLRRRSPHRGGPAQGRGAASPPLLPIAVSPRVLQWSLVLAGLSCCVAMAMPQVHLVAYCVDLGYGGKAGAQMLSLALFGGVISRLASGVLADRIGGFRTQLIGAVAQGVTLFLFLPFDGLASLYAVSFAFGLAQGGIVPSYAIIVREYLPAAEAGQRVGLVAVATILGMALGGWMSGFIYDATGSYEAAFINGILWNVLNLVIMVTLFFRTGARRPAMA